LSTSSSKDASVTGFVAMRSNLSLVNAVRDDQ
jgi:hypothetical protein